MKKNLSVIFFWFLLIVSSLSAQENDNSQSLMKFKMDSPPISVTIGGKFIVNGTITAFIGDRVDQFITRVYNETKLALYSSTKDITSLNLIRLQTENFALRNIKLIRINGDSLKLDLKKFRLTGDFSHNPYLQNDDVLIFPVLDLERNFVEISGAINALDKQPQSTPQPLKFQYVEGDKLSDALLFGQGINKAYENVEFAEISRLSYDGESEEKLIIKIDEDFFLMPGDRITVLADETNKKAFRAYVQGEVNRPGYVYVTRNSTTLREVILKAGGFTPHADLDGSELIRQKALYNIPFFSEQFDLMMMQRMSNIGLEDSTIFMVDNRLRFSRGASILDFSKVLDPESEEANFVVKDGDFISVPEKLNLVYVFGQVLNPGYIDFVSDATYDHYISKAGGLGLTARGDIYLIKGKTRAWIELSEDYTGTIEAGDYIWASKKPYRDFDYYLTRIGVVAGIVGAAATVILLFMQAFK